MQMAFSFEALLRHTWLLNRILPAVPAQTPAAPLCKVLLSSRACVKAPSAWKRQACTEHTDSRIASFFIASISIIQHTQWALSGIQQDLALGSCDGSRSDSPGCKNLFKNLSQVTPPAWGEHTDARGTSVQKHICCCYCSDVSSGDFVPFPFFLLNHWVWPRSSSTAPSPSLRTS